MTGITYITPQLISDLDKLEFAKQVVELKEQVKEMEAQAEGKDKDKVISISSSVGFISLTCCLGC